jgi:hypothetical protein
MKSVIHESTTPAKYPKLRKCGNLIVLFISPLCGTVVFSDQSEYSVGYYNDSWEASLFDDFSGEVTLSDNQEDPKHEAK